MCSSERTCPHKPVASSSSSPISAPIVSWFGTQPPLLQPRHTAGQLLDGRPQWFLYSDHRVHDAPELSQWKEIITLPLLWLMVAKHGMVFSFNHTALLWQDKVRTHTVSCGVVAITQHTKDDVGIQVSRLRLMKLKRRPVYWDYMQMKCFSSRGRRIIKKPHKKKQNIRLRHIRQVVFHSLYIPAHYWLGVACCPVHSFLPMQVAAVDWRLTALNPDKAWARWLVLQPGNQSVNQIIQKGKKMSVH